MRLLEQTVKVTTTHAPGLSEVTTFFSGGLTQALSVRCEHSDGLRVAELPT